MMISETSSPNKPLRNMYMAAAPYFQRRFHDSQSILDNFQASELSVSQITNLGSVLILAKLQHRSSYTKQIITSLLMNTACFTLLSISTRAFRDVVSAGAYFAFLLFTVFITSVAAGLMQNGSFSYVAGYRRPEYMQAFMVGHAVAGVLPPLVQLGSVLAPGRNAKDGKQTSDSAFAYFMTAVGVTLLTLVAFLYLLTAHRPPVRAPPAVVSDDETDGFDITNAGPVHFSDDNDDDEHQPLHNDDEASSSTHPLPNKTSTQQPSSPKAVPLSYLAQRLLPNWLAVSITFAVTMVFPVFTEMISSTHPSPLPPYLEPAAFIPLGLLVWNIGDLLGRLLPLAPRLDFSRRPRVLVVLAILRVLFVPLYMACNIRRGMDGTGTFDAVSLFTRGEYESAEAVRAVLPDAAYLLVVQLPFGISNGFLSSCCMMGASSFVEEDEREAAGSFMGLMLIAGLTVGSLGGFIVGKL